MPKDNRVVVMVTDEMMQFLTAYAKRKGVGTISGTMRTIIADKMEDERKAAVADA